MAVLLMAIAPDNAKAAVLLGKTPDAQPLSPKFGPTDALFFSDDFDEQRARLARLESQLPN